MSLTEHGLKICISRLVKTFSQRKRKLDKARSITDEEINKLKVLRQALVEKNLAGIYTDEIFKEQNAQIEKKVIAAQASKNDAIVDKYNINEIREFINTKLADLSQTYATSNLSQIRCLLGTVFMSGIIWGNSGCQYQKISPLYQAILDADKPGATLGEPAGDRTLDQELKRLLLYR